MLLLALETSCDETSAAVIHDGVVRSNLISSQAALHAEYGGVVPELATRQHLRNVLPIAQQALQIAGAASSDLDAVAATRGPGLPSALMIGFTAGQSLAFVAGKAFLGVHHHEAHLYSPWIWGDPPRAQFHEFEPSVSLIVSGGHTLLVHVRAELDHQVLGSTLDDAAGECFDKIAKLAGLPYPGGPALERMARGRNAAAYDLPRPLINERSDGFSFSGLKTAARYSLRDHPELLQDVAALGNFCASAQAAIVDVLVRKTFRAAQRLGVRCVTASGGVTANLTLRQELARAAQQHGCRLRLAKSEFCTDNAAMIGVLAERKLLHHTTPTSLDAEILAGWAL